jgi:hypothetical protein
VVSGVGDKTLKEAFPNLYSIVCMKDAFLAFHLKLSSGSLQWSVSYIRAAHNWKEDVFALC